MPGFSRKQGKIFRVPSPSLPGKKEKVEEEGAKKRVKNTGPPQISFNLWGTGVLICTKGSVFPLWFSGDSQKRVHGGHNFFGRVRAE